MRSPLLDFFFRTRLSLSAMPTDYRTSGNLQILLPLVVGSILGLLIVISPWLAIVIMLGVTFFVVALQKPISLCYVTVIAVALTSGIERGKPIPFFRVNELILAFASIIAFVVILNRKTRSQPRFDNFWMAIIILICGTAILPGAYYLLRGTKLFVQDFVILLAQLQYMILFWMFAYIPTENEERRKLIKLMIFCGVIVAIVGLMQAAKISFVTNFLAQWYSSSQQASATAENRITSLLAAWNGLGIFMMFNLLILWSFGISRPSDLGWTTIILAGGTCMSSLVLSGSFAGIIGLALGVALVSTILRGQAGRRNLILFFITIIVIITTSVIFRDRIQGRLDEQFGYGGFVPSTLVTRFGLWEDTYLPAIGKNLLGINPTIPPDYSWRYTESQFLDLLFSFGLTGFCAYLLWLGIVIFTLKRKYVEHRGLLKTVTAIAIAIMIVLFTAGFTNAVFTYSGTIDYVWIILALITADSNSNTNGEQLIASLHQRL